MKLLEHFKQLTIHPKNAEQLKGLILQLAIQGKLTQKWREQNPDVEPASVLLEKIKEEKAQLIKKKKVKKEKPLPKITDDEIPFDLPDSWVWCNLNDLGLIASSSRVHKKDWTDSGVPFYRAREIVKLSKFGFVENELYITEELFEKHKNNGITPFENDIMLTGVGTIGVPYIVKKEDHFYFKDASVLIFKNLFNQFSPFIELFFKTPYWIKEIHKDSMGTTVHTLTISRAKSVPTIFPPLKEQKAIVSIVNQLFTEVDQLEAQTKERIQLKNDFVTSALRQLSEAKEVNGEWVFLQQHFKPFFNTKEAVKKLRETILQLAVQGKLTSSWRASHPELVSGSHSASNLLNKIKAEKEQLIKEKKIKKEKPLPEITTDEIPYELPDGWVWCRLGDLANFINGDRGKNYPNKSEYVNDGIAWINTGHINTNGTLSVERMNFITQEKFDTLRSGKIQEGDLVYCLRGATFGKTSFVTPFKEGAVASSLMIIRNYLPDISTYVYRFLISEEGKKQLLRFDNGSAQPNLSANKVKIYVFPLPPLEEQKAIVAKVNSLMALCDQLEQEIEQNTNNIEDLMGSCLKSAFA